MASIQEGFGVIECKNIKMGADIQSFIGQDDYSSTIRMPTGLSANQVVSIPAQNTDSDLLTSESNLDGSKISDNTIADASIGDVNANKLTGTIDAGRFGSTGGTATADDVVVLDADKGIEGMGDIKLAEDKMLQFNASSNNDWCITTDSSNRLVIQYSADGGSSWTTRMVVNTA
tara:strand:- start:4739 stop:5260 length:522 start_codon:yes stop_codon:yes gene_type:complete